MLDIITAVKSLSQSIYGLNCFSIPVYNHGCFCSRPKFKLSITGNPNFELKGVNHLCRRKSWFSSCKLNVSNKCICTLQYETVYFWKQWRHLSTEVTCNNMNKVTECNATNESLNPEIELGVLEIHMVGCTEPNNKRPRHNNHVHVDRRMTTDLPRLNPQSNIDHRQMERGLRLVQLGPVSVAAPTPVPATAQ